MNYIVHTLELHKTISAPQEKTAADGTSALYEFYSSVGKNDLEPAKEAHLEGGKPASEIPAGFYLFTQGNETATTESYREAAEALWLESLWQNIEFKNDRILVRILSEDSKTVYQIFREIKGGLFQP